ncbi:2-hydroxyacid dehydrogenase [Anaerotalea alkaliphila]|uniref:D-glycerate dehydrogenase n=1 Tax=Anaerotalea alkaliphila TaxID=2662126 RepID=A0A7X5KMS0_9FIRM|nr:D-glycerate dehydrogenase [Anaerotalea alkaliphila]NDL67259.1 D-glycerate dehydrogenase [Anaerotalea alkaliphila]
MEGNGLPKVFVAQPVPGEVEAYLKEHCDCRIWRGPGRLPLDTLFSEVGEMEGVMLSGFKVNGELLDRSPKLRVVSDVSVGYNNFDLELMRARGVAGTHTPGVLDDTVADLAMGLLLAAARRIPELDRYVKDGNWQRGDNEALFGKDVHHATLGILGMGRIGEALAKRARFGFDMEVLYHNRHRKPEAEMALGVRYAGFEELLSGSDYVVLLAPLTPATRGMMDEEAFRRMKPDAVFVNVSRGETVREEALVRALSEGWIRGAGLDVYEKEPVPRESPLLGMANCVTLPHIGSAVAQTRADMAMLAARSMVAVLEGRDPGTIVPELR